MKYFYTFAKIPEDKKLMNQIDAAAHRLDSKLSNLNLQMLNISEYNQRYLGHKLSNSVATMQLYGYLLSLALHNSSVPLNQFVFVDYGGGSGVLSFLAKEMGIGTVIYNDIYDVSCEDIRRLSDALRMELDYIICGDIDDLISCLKTNHISLNAIASFDVIEHIYDIRDYLQKMARLSNRPFQVVHASGANAENPVYVFLTKRKQREAEYKERAKIWGRKERDTHRAYLEVRREMIAYYAPDLDQLTVEELARLTRGLREDDIQKCVDEYKARGDITYRASHPTNTCDPYTGNWAEHLMDIQSLEELLRDTGFSTHILSGYWASSGTSYVRLTKYLLNTIIRSLGRRALCISPYFVLYANKVAEEDSSIDCEFVS